MPPPPSSSPHPPSPPSLGSLVVQVLKASGKLFESGLRCIIRLSVGSVAQQTTARRHPLLDKRKPIAWEDESFVFPITQQIDALFVSCHRGDDDRQEMIGSAIIQLQHLPQGTDVVKWSDSRTCIPRYILTHPRSRASSDWLY